jgi:hypothetical protein
MTGATFDIVFQGKLVAGVDAGQARADLARLFKTDPARIERLFSGQRVLLKKGLDATSADNYRRALAQAGAEVELIPTGPATPAPAARPPTVAPTAPSQRVMAGTAASGNARPADAPLTVAEPGVTLIEPTVIEAPTFDLSGLTLAEPGVLLAEPTTAVAPDYDLSALTLDPPGTVLVEPATVPPADIDTSALKLAER